MSSSNRHLQWQWASVRIPAEGPPDQLLDLCNKLGLKLQYNERRLPDFGRQYLLELHRSPGKKPRPAAAPAAPAADEPAPAGGPGSKGGFFTLARLVELKELVEVQQLTIKEIMERFPESYGNCHYRTMVGALARAGIKSRRKGNYKPATEVTEIPLVELAVQLDCSAVKMPLPPVPSHSKLSVPAKSRQQTGKLALPPVNLQLERQRRDAELAAIAEFEAKRGIRRITPDDIRQYHEQQNQALALSNKLKMEKVRRGKWQQQ